MGRLLPWLIVAVVIRVLLILLTIHPDIRGYNLGAYIISQKAAIFSFYDYIRWLPRTHDWVRVFGDGLFIYPPLAYLIPAFFMKLLSPFYPWEQFLAVIKDLGEVVRSGVNISLLLFLLKVPFLVFDFAALFVITKLFEDNAKKFLAQMLWLFNPVTLYASYMVSQFDITLVFFVLLSLLFYKKQRHFLAAVSLGLAASIKVFPLLLLPFVAFAVKKDFIGRIKILALGLGTYLFIILPYLPSIGFRQYALVASQTDKMLFAKIPVSGAEFLPVFLVVYLFLLWWAFYKSQRFYLWQWFLLILLTFFSVTHYHPQWFVWISPFLILLIAENWKKFTLPVSVLVACYILIVFLFESSLNFGLFSILNPTLNQLSFSNFISSWYPPNVFASIVRGTFAATSLFVVFRLVQGTRTS